jgi:hypothetical protein
MRNRAPLHQSHEQRIVGPLTLGVYVAFCAALATLAYLRPLPTFDRYLYAGAVASLRYSDPTTIHSIARAELDAQPSPFRFENVASEPYFADVYDHPDHFAQQMGLFRVKLGYVAAGYVLWRAGLPILVGLRIISACCLFVVGLIALAWTRAPVLSALLLLTAPVLNMGRMVTADPLSSGVILLALMALAWEKHAQAAALLLASIVVRSDNVVLVLILLGWMIWSRRIHVRIGALCAVLAVTIYAIVNRFAGLYGWRVLMQHGFIQPQTEPLTYPVLISFAGYLQALTGLRAIPYTFMIVWVFVAAAVWRRLPEGSYLRSLLPVVGLFILVRLLIFPNFDDRVFTWAYLLAGVALIQATRFPMASMEDQTVENPAKAVLSQK